MPNNQIVVPPIPQEVRNRVFDLLDIRWVKTVNDKKSSSAYISPDITYPPKQCDRVITNSNGTFICLQLNRRFENSLNRVRYGDLILLYQNLERQTTKCFTHLVTPIEDHVVQNPYHYNGGNGRWVWVIAMTKKEVNNSIRFDSTRWQRTGFTGKMQDLSFQDGSVRAIPNIPQLRALQNEIWNRFQPFRV